MATGYKVISMAIENHGKVVSEELVLDGNNLIASGKTGQGKTTIVSVLWDAIVKRSGMITHGEKKEVLEVVLENKDGEKLYCKRQNTAKSSTITIHDEEGEVIPQKTVEKLLESISENPLALFELKGKERYEFLMSCSNISLKELNTLKIERESKASERLDLHREYETLSSNLAVVEKVDAIDISSVRDALSAANDTNRAVEKAEDTLTGLKDSWEEEKDTVEVLEEKLRLAKENIKTFDARIVAGHKFLDENKKVDTSELDKKIESAYENNANVTLYVQYIENRDKCDKVNNSHNSKAKEVKAIDAKIKGMLDSATFPVDGLSVDGTNVMYISEGDMTPSLFENLGTSEQILISSTLAAKHIVSKKRGIHAMRIDRAESMDAETQSKMIRVCNDIGVQLFISVVDRTVVEDGYTLEICD